MIKKELSKRSSVYIFDEIPDFETFVYVIKGQHNTFFIDTFCGPDYMKSIIDDMELTSTHNIVVINTHFHWDHIWGNNFFHKNKIVAHKSCQKLIVDNWDEMLRENSIYAKGKLTMNLPNTTSTNKISFISDGINMFYSPGHTKDCISVYDTEDEFLYVGDNLERPHVFVESDDIDAYIKTLNSYLTLKPKKIFAGHTLELDENDIQETIAYLNNLK